VGEKQIQLAQIGRGEQSPSFQAFLSAFLITFSLIQKIIYLKKFEKYYTDQETS